MKNLKRSGFVSIQATNGKKLSERFLSAEMIQMAKKSRRIAVMLMRGLIADIEAQ